MKNDPYMVIQKRATDGDAFLDGGGDDGIDHSPDAIFGSGPKNPRHDLDKVTNRMVTALMRLFPCVACLTLSHTSARWRRNAVGERLWRISAGIIPESEVVALYEGRGPLERAKERDIEKMTNAPGNENVVALPRRRRGRGVTR